MKEQTEEICLAAIEQNAFALNWVKEKTFELCLATVRKDPMRRNLIANPRSFVKQLEDNGMLTSELLRDHQGYREFLMKNRSKEVV